MAKKRKGNPVNGWVILDKPVDMGSTAAVSIVKRVFNAQKAGHAGTLDPAASGVLPIALGEATKTIPYVMDGEKVYAFTVRFGQETTTDDAQGEVIAQTQRLPDEKDLLEAIGSFIGETDQVPPKYSAVHINGRRAYDLRAKIKTSFCNRGGFELTNWKCFTFLKTVSPIFGFVVPKERMCARLRGIWREKQAVWGMLSRFGD